MRASPGGICDNNEPTASKKQIDNQVTIHFVKYEGSRSREEQSSVTSGSPSLLFSGRQPEPVEPGLVALG
jgi:hypothetical protein